jgi:hypothetical protein
MHNAKTWIFQMFQANYQIELKNIDVQDRDKSCSRLKILLQFLCYPKAVFLILFWWSIFPNRYTSNIVRSNIDVTTVIGKSLKQAGWNILFQWYKATDMFCKVSLTYVDNTVNTKYHDLIFWIYLKGAEKNIWTKEWWNDRRLEKNCIMTSFITCTVRQV